jgi:hypothetical protein
MTRKRDLSFEALAQVTATDWTVGRGKLNEALSGIRVQMPEAEDAELAAEILYRAKLYRRVYPTIVLTPQALNQNWLRVLEEHGRQREAEATNVQTPRVACDTCDGHRFVLVGRRPIPVTDLLKRLRAAGSGEQHGTEFTSPTGGKSMEPDGVEEYAPCPDCHAELDCSYRRYDGTTFRTPDPASVREMMAR